MAIITLTTGWTDDFYVAAVKGILLSAVPSVQIVDISHRVPIFCSGISNASYGISYAAHIVKHSFHFFPEGTIHIVSIASEYSVNTPFVAACNKGHYFVSTDNGIFGLLFDEAPDAMVRIEKYKDDSAPNYPAISVFAPAAAQIINEGGITGLGSPYTEYKRRGMILATVDDSLITGTIIHINAFGNVITNITRHDFDRIGRGRPFEILVQSARRKITRINRYFHETSRGELLAVFNISGYLEIAMNRGAISEILQLTPDANIMVKFFDKK